MSQSENVVKNLENANIATDCIRKITGNNVVTTIRQSSSWRSEYSVKRKKND